MDKHRLSLRFYSLIGISLLKKIIMASIGKFVLRVNPREEMPSYFVGYPFKTDSLQKTLKWSYFNEVVHFVLIFVTAAIGYFFHLKGYLGGVVFMVLVILLNVGLVFLQHLNRIRINHAINALKKRKADQQEH